MLLQRRESESRWRRVEILGMGNCRSKGKGGEGQGTVGLRGKKHR